MLLLLALIVPIFAASPAIWWDASPGNFTKISSTINIASGNVTGYYYATQWNFMNKNVAYMGWQPRKGQELQHLTYSVFGEGTWSDSPNCSGGADGGSGTSCAIEYPWKFGQNYTFVNELVSTAGGNYTWNGTIIDDITGEETHVAYYHTPQSFGLLGTAVATFDEYYLYQSLDGKCVPKSSYVQYAPIFSKDGVDTVSDFSYIINGSLVDSCAEKHNTNNVKFTKLNAHAYRYENGVFS